MSDPNDLTTREMEVLALAWQCMESEPKIDTNKLAELTGYTSGSASVTLGRIKRKLKLKAAASSGVVNTPKKAAAPRTPKSGKRGATEPAAEGTPSKKGKKASKPASIDDDDEFANFSVKKEEVNDINTGADAFYQEASHYTATDSDHI